MVNLTMMQFTEINHGKDSQFGSKTESHHTTEIMIETINVTFMEETMILNSKETHIVTFIEANMNALSRSIFIHQWMIIFMTGEKIQDCPFKAE